MKKEEEKAIRDWCETVVTLKKWENDALRLAPDRVVMMSESAYDREIQVYSGIENIAHALKAVIHIDDHSSNTYQKWIVYDSVKFFQIGFCAKAGR